MLRELYFKYIKPNLEEGVEDDDQNDEIMRVKALAELFRLGINSFRDSVEDYLSEDPQNLEV